MELRPLHNQVRNDSYELVRAIRTRFPKAEGTVVCAFGVVYAYWDDETNRTVAEIIYNYENVPPGTLFGYNYKLRWKV